MRFRVPNTGGQAAADGIGNFFRSMAMAPLYEAQAAEEAQTAGMKRDLLGAQTGQANANISRILAEAAIKEQEAKQLSGRGDVLNLMGATRAGMSVPEFQAGINERKFGAPEVGPSVLPQPIAGVGPSGRTAAFDDAILTLFGPAMATPADKTNWEQLSKARGEYRNQALGDSILAGQVDAGRAGASQAAVAGKPLVNNIGTSGAGFNQFTGEGQSLNPGMEVLFQDQGKALVGQRQAAAGASNASAGASRALAGLRGVQTNNAKVEGGLTALDYEAARAGQPLPSSNKGTSGSSATNSKFRNQIIMAAMRRPGFAVMDPAEKQDFINTELMVAGMDPVVPGELAGVSGKGTVAAKSAPGPIDANAGTKKPAIDMDAANKVKADFKAGRINREQAKAKLKALGMD